MATPKCMKCSGTMERGYIVDNTHGGQVPASWIEGAPVRSRWLSLRTGGKAKIEVATFRCTTCGFLESFARPEST